MYRNSVTFIFNAKYIERRGCVQTHRVFPMERCITYGVRQKLKSVRQCFENNRQCHRRAAAGMPLTSANQWRVLEHEAQDSDGAKMAASFITVLQIQLQTFRV